MKNVFLAVMLFLMMTLTSCEAIEGIFKAGMWVGILASAAVVGVIIWIIAKVAGKK